MTPQPAQDPMLAAFSKLHTQGQAPAPQIAQPQTQPQQDPMTAAFHSLHGANTPTPDLTDEHKGFLNSLYDSTIGGAMEMAKTAIGTKQLSEIKDDLDKGNHGAALLKLAKYVTEGGSGRLGQAAVDSSISSAKQVPEDIKQGNYGSAMTHTVGAVPLAGPILARPVEQAGQGDYAGAVGTVLGTGLSAMLPEAAEGIRSSPGLAGRAVADKIFNGTGRMAPESAKAASDLGLNPSKSQQTGSPVANIMENAFAGREKIAKQIGQQTQLSGIQEGLRRGLSNVPIGPLNNPSTSIEGAGAQGAIRGNLELANAVEKNAYDKFEQKHLTPNTQNFRSISGYKDSGVLGPDGELLKTPVYEDKTIVGPIATPEASAWASQIKPQLDAYTKGDTFQLLPDYQKGKISNLKSTIDNLVQGTDVLGPDGQNRTLPLKDYQTVKQMITNINQSVGGAVEPNLQEGGLSKLASLLDKDRDTSIATWKNGTSATADLEAAKAATKYKYNTFNQEITSRIFKNGDKRISADPSSAFDNAYSSPEQAQKFMTAMGPQNARYIKSDYFDNVLTPKMYDAATGSYNNPNALINELSDPNSVAQTIFTGPERQGIMQFAKAAQSVAPQSSGWGNLALAFNNGRILLHIGSALGGAMLGKAALGSSLAGAAGTVGVEMALSNFAKNVLLNPKGAYNASRLLKTPVSSAEALSRSAMLLSAMRGSQVQVQTAQGKKNGVIAGGGKIKLSASPQ